MLEGAGAVVEDGAGAEDCVDALADGLGPNKLGAAVVPAGPEVPGAVLAGFWPPKAPKRFWVDVAGAVVEGVLPARLPKRLGIGAAAGAVVLGAVVVGFLGVNKLGVDVGAEDVGGLLRPPKKPEPPVAGVVEPPPGLGVPKGLLAG